MKIGKSTVPVPVKKEGGDYLVFDTIEEMLDEDGAATAEFCAHDFERMTGLTMVNGEMALVTFDIVKVDKVKKKADYIVEKVK